MLDLFCDRTYDRMFHLTFCFSSQFRRENTNVFLDFCSVGIRFATHFKAPRRVSYFRRTWIRVPFSGSLGKRFAERYRSSSGKRSRWITVCQGITILSRITSPIRPRTTRTTSVIVPTRRSV